MKFPKFLRVAPLAFFQNPVRINESTIVTERTPYLADTRLLNVVAEALGFSYEVVFPPDDDQFGMRLPNGSWTGAFGILQRGEADLLIGPLNMCEELNENFRLSYPHSMSDSTFVTRKPEPLPNAAVFLHPFSIHVWLAIIACLCVVPFIFPYLLRRKHSALKLFTSTVGPLVGQGMELIPRRLREYIVLGTWIIGSALLYYFYAAVLLSFVTLPPLQGIRTIEDLAKGIKDEKYHCTMHPGASYADILSENLNPFLQVIGKNLKKNEVNDDFIAFLETFSDDNKPAFVGVRATFLPFKEFYFISEESFWPASMVYGTQKDFCCGSEVDKVIHRIWASGILKKFQSLHDHVFIYFYWHIQNYEQYWDSAPSKVPLTMTMLKGPLMLLIVSHSLAFFVFLIELCIGKYKAP